MFERSNQCQSCWFWSRKSEGKKVCANKASMYHNKDVCPTEGCKEWEKKHKGEAIEGARK